MFLLSRLPLHTSLLYEKQPQPTQYNHHMLLFEHSLPRKREIPNKPLYPSLNPPLRIKNTLLWRQSTATIEKE